MAGSNGPERLILHSSIAASHSKSQGHKLYSLWITRSYISLTSGSKTSILPSSEYVCETLYKMICPEQRILGTMLYGRRLNNDDKSFVRKKEKYLRRPCNFSSEE